MEVVQYEKKYQDKWEEFVNDSSNGTIFHTRRFLSYHAADKFRDNSLLFFDEKKLIAVFPAIDIKTRRSKGIMVAYGSKLRRIRSFRKPKHKTVI